MSFDAKRAIFNQVDANADGVIDQGEFNQFVSGAGTGWNAGWGSASGVGLGYGAGLGLGYSSTAGLGYGGWSGTDASSLNLGYTGYNAGYGDYYGYGAGSAALAAGGVGASYVASGGQAYDAGAAAYGSAAFQQYAADANGNFIDSNPEIIRRPAATGVQTYTQNVAVRFLQPPPVPPPGPLIIREVRPPQPPPPAPLRLRQQAPPLPTPPPLVLRERPPQPPPVIPSQTVIRRLAAIPVPPRSVIIERLPPLPPKPRDIVLERWLPYGPRPARRTLVQRAGPAVQYPRPRNVIVQYDPVPARVVRQVQRLGVTVANPAAYYNTYGASLLDSTSLVSAARSAGVVEDITPPGVAYGFNAATYGQDLSGVASWGDLSGAGWGGAGWSGAGWGGAGWGGAGWGGASLGGASLGGAGWGGAGYTLGSGYVGDAYQGWNGGLSSSVYESGSYGGYGLVGGGGYYGAEYTEDAGDQTVYNSVL